MDAMSTYGINGGEPRLGNLPAQWTELVGREGALSELSALVWRSRLLTLCGPGGAGKTRLAVALAQAVQADFVDGAWWVDLSATVDSGSVAQVIAAAVAPDALASESVSGAIARRFADSALLVLDSCERVVGGCAEVVLELLGRAQSLKVIMTSREPLGVPGEQVWRVPGLSVGECGSAARERDSVDAAVELFLERARESASSFDPACAGVREAATRICRWLDGMPLSIELAAAQVSVLGVAEIAERLESGTGFLRHAGRAVPERHRTIRDNLNWSHRTLQPEEQRLFRRLGAFRGSFSLGASEAVGADRELPADDVLGLPCALVARSLVQVVEELGSPRYRLLAPVRQYAAGKLEDSGEASATRRRHALYFQQLVRDAQPGLTGADQHVPVSGELELEHENLIEALHWLLANSAADGARLASSLWPTWWRCGYYREARDAFEGALGSGRVLPTAVRAAALRGAGEAALLQCEYEVAAEHLRSALELSLELGDCPGAATALQRLGSIAREQGRFDQARFLHSQSLAIWAELGDRRGIAASQNHLGFVALLAGDPQAAESLCLAALAEFRQAASPHELVGTLVNLGASALYRDRLELAGDRLEEALLIARSLGLREGIAWSLHELAVLARRRRQPLRERAPMLREALFSYSRLGDRRRTASVLEEIAGSLLLRQDPQLAVVLLACVEQVRAQLQTPIPPVEVPDHAATRSRLDAKLSRVSFDSAWSAGRELQLEQAVDRALRAIEQRERGVSEAPGQRTAPILTPREVTVLELVSEGQTNRAIAEALYISTSTAGVHVFNILNKLGAGRRVEAAGLAHTLGLLPVG
jgi:predicted ATPase/DNA-binding CsgD family transcriptional regulator